ncbi:MAG: 50S ribosomal protein L11 methyltransferase [Lachnospiraceae bacterium]|nr:50S ribosomal protein L11 methyltransferase [Lachnospiraceae bacterium]
MKYIKYRIKTLKTATDILGDLLSDLGIDGIEIEDGEVPLDTWTAGTYLESLPENEVPDGVAFVSFYLDSKANENQDMEQRLQELLDGLKTNMDIGEASISVSETEDQDWINNWKQYFSSFTIEFPDGKSAYFVPSWEEPESGKRHDYLVRTDPGAAFGTGAHESTSLAMKLLEKHAVKDGILLDIGTGSGILSVMAFLFGMKKAVATDIDSSAIDAANDNLKANSLTDRDFELYIGDIIEDLDLRKKVKAKGPFDIIIANILPDVLTKLSPLIPDLLSLNGIYITSGIILEKADYMRSVFAAEGLKVVDNISDNEWTAFSVEKDSNSML